MAFVESEVALSAPQSDKQPLRAHLESQWRQTGIPPAMLRDAPELPALGAHVWAWFCELSRERGYGMEGPCKITHRDITEWARAYGITVRAWERRAIKQIDAVYLGSSKRSEEE